MLDRVVRRRLAGPLEVVAARIDRPLVTPARLTGLGFACGVGACAAAATTRWELALVLWLANRFADGLDGPLARRRGVTPLGGFLDIMADFSIYAGFVVGVAIAIPDARLAAALLLGAYYLSGTAFLAWSAIAARLEHTHPDERSLHFVGGVAEGTETAVVYVAITLFPHLAAPIMLIFAAAVTITALQRIWFVRRALATTGTD